MRCLELKTKQQPNTVKLILVLTHRGDILDFPAESRLPREIGQVQEVVHNHLANDVVARETVKVIDAEV